MSFDVIIPCAGSGEYIEATLQGIRQQTRKPDAVYLVDNASGHAVYRQAAQDSGLEMIRYVRFEQRLPMTQNWQRCLGVGDGEICLLLNDDDIPRPDAFEAGLRALEKRPDATGALLPPVYVRIGDEEEAWHSRVLERFRWIDALPEPSRAFFLSTGAVNHMSAFLFRRGPWSFFPHLRWMPDQGFLFSHAVQGAVVLVKESGVAIRQHERSLTMTLFTGGKRAMSEERLYLRMVFDVFLEERGLKASDVAAALAYGNPYYAKRLLQACFSWPLRRDFLALGRALAREPAMQSHLRRELGAGAYCPKITALLTSLAADLRYSYGERPRLSSGGMNPTDATQKA